MTQPPRGNTPPPLGQLQAEMQDAILNGGIIPAAIVDGPHASRDTLFGVYSHAYVSRLIEVLAADYPLVRSYVGEEGFRTLARSYVVANPSRHQNARWFGDAFVEFIVRHAGAVPHPELAEIAAIERATSDAFDSVDAPALGFDDLAAHPPEHWADLSFALHPSASLLICRTNAFDIWRALKDEQPPPPAAHSAIPHVIAVWRQDVTPRVRLLSGEEAMAMRETQRGVRFGALCTLLATFDDPDTAPARAAGYLQGWLAAEMLSSVRRDASESRGPLKRRREPGRSRQAAD